mgnify:CR=1 FL=1
MLLQAKCKYVINIIGRNHLELDIKGVCMKQKTKTYFKGLFEYLKGLGVIKIILYVFSIVLFIAEFYSAVTYKGIFFWFSNSPTEFIWIYSVAFPAVYISPPGVNSSIGVFELISIPILLPFILNFFY